jgi:hypothetical protein
MHYEVIFDFLSKGPIPWSFCVVFAFMTGGFNQTVNHGGPIREGLRVRISYMATSPNDGRNVILRLEAQKP